MILVGVPTLKPLPKHVDHLTEWYAQNKDRHSLRLERIWYRALHQAQGHLVTLARRMGAEYILFTEDDQWGYPIDGLEILLEADKDVIGFRSYFKTYPFLSMAMRRKEPGSLITRTTHLLQIEGTHPDEPIQKVDLLSWAFTLVKMSVFDRMDAAGLNPFDHWGPVPTDSFFCQYCDDLGIEKYCHFGFTIGHGDVPPRQLHQHRQFHETINARRGFTKGMQIPMEDDYGHAYGRVDFEPEAAKILRAFQAQESVGAL